VTRPPGTARRRPRWAVISGLLLAKVLIIAGIVLLPSGLAISLGAAHGIVLLVVGGSAAVALLVARRRGGSVRPASSPPGAHHGHGSVFALATRIFKKGAAK
jgi:hypothetical protein